MQVSEEDSMLPGEDPATAHHMMTKDEFFEAMRRIKPDLTRDEYDQKWEDFCDRREEHYRRMSQQ